VRPALPELEQQLRADLARLGKSAKTPASAPSGGASNAVFDLAASVIDPDGPPDGQGGGELPPTGIALAWTERLLGDYDQNGQVNVPDLVLLAAHWLAPVGYDDPALHGGIAFWPSGDPDDDGGTGGVSPPSDGSGAANWRLARTDGDADGHLYLGDVTTIAQHWKEQSAGYRVYAKLPGATEYQFLPADGGHGGPPRAPTQGEVTLPRSAAFPDGQSSPDPTRPVRFHFSYGDGATALPEGRYAFYVTAYDAVTDTDGPANAAVIMDIIAGVANQPPVARLSLSPDFAGAPAVITFDASQSYDPDGSIVEYRWYFDADGIVDWSTSDSAPPAASSSGEVDAITPGDPPGPGLPPATVIVTYERTAGYADYVYPRVRVIDDKGGVATRAARLGVSGWEILETLSSNREEYDPPGDELLIAAYDMGFEPGSGLLAAVGKNSGGEGSAEFGNALMYWRRLAPNDWEYEYIKTDAQPLPDGMGETLDLVKAKLFWDEAGQPMVVFCYYQLGAMDALVDFRTYLARRTEAGVWNLSVLFAGTQPDGAKGARGAAPDDAIQPTPGELRLLMYNQIATAVYGTYFYNYQYVTYKDGVINVEPIGWPEPDDPTNGAYGLLLSDDSAPCVLVRAPDTDPTSIWWRKRNAPGVWATERLDHGELSSLADAVYGGDPFIDRDGYLNLCTL
jgi:hypothetical protein